MSRRDTIIIAVLINAGLLIVLFTTALKSGGAEEDVAHQEARESAFVETIAPVTLPEIQKTSQMGDEVDQLLKQYQQFASVSSVEEKKEIPSFADELTLAPNPVATAPVKERASSQESSVIEVKVKKGDVLEKLARFHKTTVSEIMKLNRLTNSNLKIGQILRIPTKAKKAVATSLPETSSEQNYYVMKSGDTPWAIALKHQMKLEDLLELNKLDKDKARKLKAGDRLRVR